MKRTLLLNPGPVNVSRRVQDALLRGDLCHREKEFSDLTLSIREKLLFAFSIQNEFAVALVTGSGTAALEMAVSSSLSPGKSMLIVQNGVYGERIARIAAGYGFQKIILDYNWGQPPRLADIENTLDRHPEIEVVSMVHHETSTGVINPVAEISDRVRERNRKFLVDCVSSLAGEEIDLNPSGIDFAVGTANKCIQGLPGVSFVLFRRSEIDRLAGIPERSLYLNLSKNFNAQEQGDTLFTPAVQVHYALDEALDELIEESVPARILRYRNAASFLRKGFLELGLENLINEKYHSNTLTALKLPEGISYDALHAGLKEKGFVVYAGQGNLSQSIFRVANMGDIRREEFGEFMQSLEACLNAAAQHGP